MSVVLVYRVILAIEINEIVSSIARKLDTERQLRVTRRVVLLFLFKEGNMHSMSSKSNSLNDSVFKQMFEVQPIFRKVDTATAWSMKTQRCVENMPEHYSKIRWQCQ